VSAATTERAADLPVELIVGDPESDARDDVSVWRTTAVMAMVASAIGIAATNSMDLCGPVGPWVLGFAWLVVPVVAISSIIGVALVGGSIFERISAAVVAGAITGAWLFALTWASVGEAMLRTAC
jgi:hypothetical protein